ncbi:MAG: hypothetical protein PH343_09855, partial [Nitrospira sp.]|nr:hypothetical protein [Nitrospira sp.]
MRYLNIKKFLNNEALSKVVIPVKLVPAGRNRGTGIQRFLNAKRLDSHFRGNDRYISMPLWLKNLLIIFVLFILTSGCTGKEGAKGLITVSPQSTVVKMGSTAQFSVSPSGTSVTWSIKNDSEPLLGVIDSSGSYTAPSDSSTAPEKVVLTATDSSGATGSATAFLTTFNMNKRLTENYAEGQYKADTYSSGQKSIAVFGSGGVVNIYTVWADNSIWAA